MGIVISLVTPAIVRWPFAATEYKFNPQQILTTGLSR